MPQYKPYATKKSTPSRKARKGDRNTIFKFNKLAGRVQRKARKDLRDARLEAEAAASAEAEENEQVG